MAGSLRLVDLVQERIDDFLARRSDQLGEISGDLIDLVSASSDLLRGGKRFRALFCYWGWQSVAGSPRDGQEVPAVGADDLGPVVAVSAALELFHAAALVHDDIMDDSDRRRGMPSMHRRFEALHRERGMLGDSERYGRSAALLLGDLLLGWSDELLDLGLARVPDADARAARAEFVRMRSEVTAGQHLDVLEEGSWREHDDQEQLRRAHRVILYKSAKYSVEAPLVIGAALAGADTAQLLALRGYGVPLGVAFQLRDDLLGVFGDPAVTGKPAGDDLREGKRTVLIALARRELPATAVRLLDELLGDRELDESQVAMLQRTLRDSGAVDRVEELIARDVDRAVGALGGARISGSARAELGRLADAVTRRQR
ncbi:MAG: polyprenyl synthetase family protein [Micrococcales bacterium]|nr:polyprenyl synthetase family protein [Micrococcales bacterium]